MFVAVVVAVAGDDGSVRDSVNSIADAHDQIVLALIAIVAACTAALVWVIKNSRWTRIAADQATAANAAVNNVGPGQHSLYDMVAGIRDDVETLKREQHEFDGHGWDHLPADIGDAVALTTTVRNLQAMQAHCAEQIDRVLHELRDHVAWEMTAKYPDGD